MRITCVSLSSGMLESTSYQTPKGNKYLFARDQYTEVKDPDDAKYFLNCGDGQFFKAETIGEKITNVVHKVFPKPTPKKTALHTEEQLMAMTKSEQTEIIRKYSSEPIPKLERDRVKLILDFETSAA